MSWLGFSPTWFFSGKILLFVWVASTSKKKNKKISIPLSLFCLSSFCCYTSTISSHFPSTIPSLSLPRFYQEATFSISQSHCFLFPSSSLSSLTVSLFLFLSSLHFLCHVGMWAHSPDQPGLYNWLPPSSAQPCTYNIVAFQFLI